MDNIKSINIKQYLKNRGITPVNDRNYYGMYLSPFRNDNNPSFKVDYIQNLWYDFGTGKGGSIIDLVMKMENCTLAESIRKLENKDFDSESFSFHRNTGKQQTPEITILKVVPVSNPVLIDYLNERKINIEIAKLHCKEVHYCVGEKQYFAVGFQNNSGGYELRNKYFKGCTSKDITTFDNHNNHCCVFEGFIDYLSFLTQKGQPGMESNIIILNSVNNLNKVVNFLKQYNTIYTYLDNDEAGKKCLNEIQRIGKTVSNQSGQYHNYKDLNDYLCDKKMIQQKQQKRGMRL